MRMSELLRQIILHAQTLSPEEQEILARMIPSERRLPVIEL